MQETVASKQSVAAIAIPQVYKASDIVKAENPKAYSTLGHAVLSEIPSSPNWSFPKGTRKGAEKAGGSKAVCQSLWIGKTSPGPVYNPNPLTVKESAPKWSFATDSRMAPISKPYDHYLIQDKVTDSVKARLATQPNSPTVNFGVASRVTLSVRPKCSVQSANNLRYSGQGKSLRTAEKRKRAPVFVGCWQGVQHRLCAQLRSEFAFQKGSFAFFWPSERPPQSRFGIDERNASKHRPQFVPPGLPRAAPYQQRAANRFPKGEEDDALC